MTEPVRIPADVERPDRVLANLTGRQLALLAATGAVLYVAWTAARAVVPPLLFLGLAAPVAAAAAMLALGSRDGVSLDRLAVAALRQRLAPTYRVTAPDGVHPAPAWLTNVATTAGGAAGAAGSGVGARGAGGAGQVSPVPLRLPAQAVDASAAGEVGVVDLGPDGLAVVAVCSTVNFALRTPAEQDSLVAVFGRWLHSLTAGVQILVRAERLDLSGQIAELRERAPGLPHPALEAAAAEHADYLEQLAERAELLRRQVLLVLREPVPVTLAAAGPLAGLPIPGRRRATRTVEAGREAGRRAAEARLARRLTEAGALLAPAGITVTGLDPAQATAVLAAACNPDSLLRPGAGIAGLAAADEVITTAPDTADDPDTAPAGPAGLPGLAGLAGSGGDVDGSIEEWDGRWAA